MATSKLRKKPAPAAADAPDAAYHALAREFARDPRVTPPAAERGRFGANGYKVDGKVFAMSVGGALVVKLSKREVDAAIAAGQGERLAMGGRVMKEWLVVDGSPATWRALARRARAFVSGDA